MIQISSFYILAICTVFEYHLYCCILLAVTLREEYMETEFDEVERRCFLERVMEIEEKYAFVKLGQNTSRIDELQKLLDSTVREVK